jgi:hypothetical protein
MKDHAMKPRNLAILAAIVVIAALAISRATAPSNPVPAASDVPHYGTADLQVRITAEPVVSRNQVPVLVQLESGDIPAGVNHLTVLTDENCAADGDGVSHCLNRVTFETPTGTGEAVLRHHHRMAEEPCLSPGQSLHLVP